MPARIEDEFGLIDRLRGLTPQHEGTLTGIGDDAAVLEWSGPTRLAFTTDTLVADVHFPLAASGDVVAHRALATNLSDLAAMGAVPRAFTLALTLPGIDAEWVSDFARTLGALATAWGIELVGGDTTQGPVAVITLQAWGELPDHRGLLRSGARVGDDIYVSACPGEAALGLQCVLGRAATGLEESHRAALAARYTHPTPRVALGRALGGLAHAAIDISDGLAQDLGHVLRASDVGATLWTARLPVSAALAAWPDQAAVLRAALAGGDDYELLFTTSPADRSAVAALAQQLGLPLTCIGRIDAEPGLRLLDAEGRLLEHPPQGYRHFSGTASA